MVPGSIVRTRPAATRIARRPSMNCRAVRASTVAAAVALQRDGQLTRKVMPLCSARAREVRDANRNDGRSAVEGVGDPGDAAWPGVARLPLTAPDVAPPVPTAATGLGSKGAALQLWTASGTTRRAVWTFARQPSSVPDRSTTSCTQMPSASSHASAFPVGDQTGCPSGPGGIACQHTGCTGPSSAWAVNSHRARSPVLPADEIVATRAPPALAAASTTFWVPTGARGTGSM